jgi:phytanoyl-CoA hydroxylase
MSPDSRRDGPRYQLTEDEHAAFARDGYVHLHGVLAEAEVAALAEVVDRFLRREIPVAGKDFCDMSGDYTRTPEQYSIFNVMLPRKYHPAWQGNVYEQRAAHIAAQLCGDGMELDYDQLLAKRPFKSDAVFHWHQDLAYWPVTSDPRTASFWLAIDDATVSNGCVRFVPGSHREPRLRPHQPLLGDRDQSHTLVAQVDEAREVVWPAELRRGDVTVHHERTVHGSGGNHTASWRRAYILAFRSKETVAEERRLGFTHSHNDQPHVLAAVGREQR